MDEIERQWGIPMITYLSNIVQEQGQVGYKVSIFETCQPHFIIMKF